VSSLYTSVNGLIVAFRRQTCYSTIDTGNLPFLAGKLGTKVIDNE
jgi:hypothetical protein